MRIKDIAVVAQGPKIRLGQIGRTIRHEDGKLIDEADAVLGIAPLRKGGDAEPTLEALHKKVEELNES